MAERSRAYADTAQPGLGVATATSFGQGTSVGLRARFGLAPSTESPGRDPAWGDLPAQPGSLIDPWLTGSKSTTASGIESEVELLGNGFRVSGRLCTGRFDRLSDWLNVQTGFIPIEDGAQARPGPFAEAAEGRKTLWIRLDQVVLVAQRSTSQASRPGAPVVPKQRLRVSITTTAYSLAGFIHVHAFGSMAQFLESPDLPFMPVTEVTVRRLDDPRLISRYAFAMLNRRQIVTVADDSVEAGREEPGLDEGQGRSVA